MTDTVKTTAKQLFKQYPNTEVFYIADNGVSWIETNKDSAYQYGSKYKVSIHRLTREDIVDKTVELPTTNSKVIKKNSKKHIQ